jgi:hypothetical protein
MSDIDLLVSQYIYDMSEHKTFVEQLKAILRKRDRGVVDKLKSFNVNIPPNLLGLEPSHTQACDDCKKQTCVEDLSRIQSIERPDAFLCKCCYDKVMVKLFKDVVSVNPTRVL